jgi:hypothetical protein
LTAVATTLLYPTRDPRGFYALVLGGGNGKKKTKRTLTPREKYVRPATWACCRRGVDNKETF